MYLLDTVALSELRRPDKADRGLAAWAAGTVPAELYMSAISLFEIELGAALIARKDPARGSSLRGWIDRQVLPGFSSRILAVDAAVAQRCAALHVPVPRPQRDGLIAATALVHGLVVVTRNVRDFEPMGVRLLNPWSGG